MSLFQKFTTSPPFFRIHPYTLIWFSLELIATLIINVIVTIFINYHSYSFCLCHLLSYKTSCRNWGLHWSKTNVIKLLQGSPILGQDNVIVLTRILKCSLLLATWNPTYKRWGYNCITPWIYGWGCIAIEMRLMPPTYMGEKNL